MDVTVLAIFVLVYLGMAFGRYPGLAIDRTGITLLGAIAIVVEQAARMGVRITWWEHAKVGIPVTALTLLIAGLWLWATTAF